MSSASDTPGWKLLRGSFSDQRVWLRRGTELHYLADHSGDGRRHTGWSTPDDTHDGPLQIIRTCPILELEDGYACVAVICERDNSEASVLIGDELMYWLINNLKMRRWSMRGG